MAKLLPNELVETTTIADTDVLVVQKDGELSAKYITGANASLSFADGVGEDSQLQLITETDGETNTTGWRLFGRDEDNHGQIGDTAIDLSYSSAASASKGATGTYSFATGYDTTVSGMYSTVSGNLTENHGEQSSVEGHGGINYGNDGHIQNHYGYIGPDSHACHVGGFGNTISMSLSDASDVLSFSIGGGRTVPPGGGNTEFEGATAIGMHTFARGYGAYVSGYGTVVDKLSEEGKHAIGTYNKYFELGQRVLDVGIGGSDANRKNGLEVYSSGRVRAPELSMADIDNDLESSEAGFGDRTLITKEYADANYSGGGSTIINTYTGTGTGKSTTTMFTGLNTANEFVYRIRVDGIIQDKFGDILRGGTEIYVTTSYDSGNILETWAAGSLFATNNSEGSSRQVSIQFYFDNNLDGSATVRWQTQAEGGDVLNIEDIRVKVDIMEESLNTLEYQQPN